ncbi:hypothetical protein [Clostridium sp.]|uniref:hypothetical protein n=1 Tax=Clostridium sp. TaxID=1506 RepID=UPI003995B938
MVVKDLIKYLSKYNEDSPVWIENEKGNNLLDIREVTNGMVTEGEFIVIIPEVEEE